MKPLGVLPVFAAGYILKPHLDFGRPLNLVGKARHGDASFHMPHRLCGLADDFRVDVGEDSSRRQLQNENALLDADMGGGDADAGRGAHRVDQVGDQIVQLLVENRDRRADFGQTGMGIG